MPSGTKEGLEAEDRDDTGTGKRPGAVKSDGTHVDVFVVARPACQDHFTRELNFVQRSRSLSVGGHGCQSS